MRVVTGDLFPDPSRHSRKEGPLPRENTFRNDYKGLQGTFNPSTFLVGTFWAHYNCDRLHDNPKVSFGFILT